MLAQLGLPELVVDLGVAGEAVVTTVLGQLALPELVGVGLAAVVSHHVLQFDEKNIQSPQK